MSSLFPLSVLKTELSETPDTSLTALYITARTRRESKEKNMWTLIFCGSNNIVRRRSDIQKEFIIRNKREINKLVKGLVDST
jgi:hypothetical protein